MAPTPFFRPITQEEFEVMDKNDSAFTAIDFESARAALPGGIVDYHGQTFRSSGTTTHKQIVLRLSNEDSRNDIYDGKIIYTNKFPYYVMHDEDSGRYINGSGPCKGLCYEGPLLHNLASGIGVKRWLEWSDVWMSDSIEVGDQLGVRQSLILLGYVLSFCRCLLSDAYSLFAALFLCSLSQADWGRYSCDILFCPAFCSSIILCVDRIFSFAACHANQLAV
jgi:hypothetical protein